MRIKRIELQNYRAFKAAERIEVDGKNLLIYGNNGSGKSSLYRALYQLLQSSNYDQAQLTNHFSDQEFNRNLFATGVTSYVRLVVDNSEEEEIYTFAADGNTVGNMALQLANQASDFMNYRLLAGVYTFATAEADLFPLFQTEFLPYWTDLARSITYATWYQELQNAARQLELDRVRRNERRYREVEERVAAFNTELTRQLLGLNEPCNLYLRDYFLEGEPIEVGLEVTGAALGHSTRDRYKLRPPTIQLRLTYYDKPIIAPHLFLNEARLTALALALRFAAFENFLKDAPLKFLVLDDLLISLDMSLRMRVIRTIVAKCRDYQLIIMTHDRGFFNVIRQNLLLDDEWLALEFYENRVNGQYASPLVLSNKDALTRAEEYFTQKDYEACALYLRKKAEELIRLYFDPTLEELARFTVLEKLANALDNIENEGKRAVYRQITSLLESETFTTEHVDLLRREPFRGDGTLSGPQIGQINHFRTQLLNGVRNYYAIRDEEKRKLDDLIRVAAQVNEVRGRVLNLGAHYTEEPLFEQELQEAIETLKQFEQAIKTSA